MTKPPADEPREFWFRTDKDKGDTYFDTTIYKTPREFFDKPCVHVIEKSAYDAVAKELAGARCAAEMTMQDMRHTERELAAVTARKDEYLSRCQEYSTTIAGLTAELNDTLAAASAV